MPQKNKVECLYYASFKQKDGTPEYMLLLGSSVRHVKREVGGLYEIYPKAVDVTLIPLNKDELNIYRGLELMTSNRILDLLYKILDVAKKN